MAKKSDNKLAYGLTIMVFGLIFLLDRTGILHKIPHGEVLTGVGTLFLIAGIIFLITRAEKALGIILTAIGVIINADFFFGWMTHYSNLIVPIILIVAGLVLVLLSRRR